MPDDHRKGSGWRGKRAPRGWRRMVREVLAGVRSTQSAGVAPVQRVKLGFVRLTDRVNVQSLMVHAADNVRYCSVCDKQTIWRRGACTNVHILRHCRECRGVQPISPTTGGCVNSTYHPVRAWCKVCARRTRHDHEGRCYNIGNHDRVSKWCPTCARETRRHPGDGRCIYDHGYEE